jgi:hypothetical protein
VAQGSLKGCTPQGIRREPKVTVRPDNDASSLLSRILGHRPAGCHLPDGRWPRKNAVEDKSVTVLGEPEVSIRSGNDSDWVHPDLERKPGQRSAIWRHPADLTSGGEPEIPVRAGRDPESGHLEFRDFPDRRHTDDAGATHVAQPEITVGSARHRVRVVHEHASGYRRSGWKGKLGDRLRPRTSWNQREQHGEERGQGRPFVHILT